MKTWRIKFWRKYFQLFVRWRIRGSLDTYPQHAHVIAGPIDNPKSGRAFRISLKGWKSQGQKTYHMKAAKDLVESALLESFLIDLKPGDWILPVGLDAKRHFLNIHTAFRRSSHPERDAAYLARYFDHHLDIH
ncbi:MAG: hypothetical protein ACPGYK_00280 [Flavobacteriales bacterium]